MDWSALVGQVVGAAGSAGNTYLQGEATKEAAEIKGKAETQKAASIWFYVGLAVIGLAVVGLVWFGFRKARG